MLFKHGIRVLEKRKHSKKMAAVILVQTLAFVRDVFLIQASSGVGKWRNYLHALYKI